MECTAESSCENGGSQAQPTRERGVGRTGFSVAWTHTRSTGHKHTLPLVDIKASDAHALTFLPLLLSILSFQQLPSGDVTRNYRSNYWFVVTTTQCFALSAAQYSCRLNPLNRCSIYHHVVCLCSSSTHQIRLEKAWQVSSINLSS